MLSSKLPFLYLTIGMLSSIGCGVQTESRSGISVSARATADINPQEVTKLALSTGQAEGSAVEFPPGAFPDGLPEGAQPFMQRTDKPAEFSADGVSAASPAIEIGFTAGDITELAEPMKITLPVVSSAGLYLDEVSKEDTNLCVFLKSKDKLFVWRRSAISINEKLASISSIHVGIFQLVYCGTSDLPGFTDATAAGATEGLKSFQLRFDSSLYQTNAEQLCFVLSSIDESTASETVIFADKAAMNSTALFSRDFSLGLLSEKTIPYLKIFFQSKDQACTYNTGDTLTAPSFLQAIAFKLSKEQLKKGTASGSFGSGIYTVDNMKFTLGNPVSTDNMSTLSTTKKICLLTEKNELGEAQLNGEISTANSSLSFYVPHQDNQGKATIYIGSLCDAISDTKKFDDKSEPYKIVINAPVSDTYYATPIKLTTSNFLTGNNNNMCLEFFAGDKIDANNIKASAFETESKNADLIGQWSIAVSKSYELLLPWNTIKTSAQGVPIFDVLITPNMDNCTTKISSVIPLPQIPQDDVGMTKNLSIGLDGITTN